MLIIAWSWLAVVTLPDIGGYPPPDGPPPK